MCVEHQDVSAPEEQREFDGETAGASARRAHGRRKATRESRVREKHPRLGGLMLALRAAPRHETAWATGAGGEEHVAQKLARHLDDCICVLHDRRVPGSRANIDHIAVAPLRRLGYRLQALQGKVAVSKHFGSAKLTIAGRSKSKNWDIFAATFSSKKAVEKVMASLNMLRGPIAHFSPLAEDEVVRLRLTVRDWFRLKESAE